MTFQDNINKAYKDQINGINTKQCKSVNQYDLTNNFIKTFYSINQAQRETGVYQCNISSACNGKLKTAGKFIWRFK